MKRAGIGRILKRHVMLFDPNNKVIKLCARGIGMEGDENEAALGLYEQAWNEAETDIEKLTAAHYIARQQKDIACKLTWDETALKHALNLSEEGIQGSYPSLCLNVAKCHEDLGDKDNARKYYKLAYSFIAFLSDDGYGKMIKAGVANGMERVK